MKKVIALALAVLMLATLAFAVNGASVAPGGKIKISKTGVSGIGNEYTVIAETSSGVQLTTSAEIAEYIPRSVTSTNYSITNVKYKVGKGLVESVTINDTEERVEVKMTQDLTNVKAKDFEVSFKLKGKAKYTLKDSDEAAIFDSAKGNEGSSTAELSKVTLPTLDFNIIGTVGYGKVSVSVGSDTDEEIDGLQSAVDWDYTDFNEDILKKNIFNFSKGDTGSAGTGTQEIPMAGAYTADAILYQEYGDALSMEARVYDGDKLYLYVDNSPNKTIVNRLADSDGDLDFYLFEQSNKDYVTLNSNAKLYFNDADEDSFVYAINNDGYLVPANGEYSEDDGCWVIKARTLGRYVVSDVELKDNVVVGGADANGNPDTGANDVVGIATALAAVALVSAAAISLKK